MTFKSLLETILTERDGFTYVRAIKLNRGRYLELDIEGEHQSFGLFSGKATIDLQNFGKVVSWSGEDIDTRTFDKFLASGAEYGRNWKPISSLVAYFNDDVDILTVIKLMRPISSSQVKSSLLDFT